ncbi:MAG: DUF3368 domain-containing protein [Candidatus Micrarchaeota archaeon]
MVIVSNSTPLICLAKINQLNLLKKLFKEIIITKEVYEEVVVRGKEESYSDSTFIEQAINEEWIKVVEHKISKTVLLFTELDVGEISSISLALNKNADFILIDEAAGRHVARSFQLKTKGTLGVLLLAYRKNLITKEYLKDLIAFLIANGFRISSELYSSVVNEIDRT